MEKRVVFKNKILPYFLVAPQIIITLVFFIWPAFMALYQSVLQEDPFGLSTAFVGSVKIYLKFSSPTKTVLSPKASSCRTDWYRAIKAGQMKNTRVMIIWGATRK